MDEKEILNKIEERLNKIGYTLQELTPLQKKHLYKIEKEISKRILEQTKNLDHITENKINISSLSKSISLARKTIYNNIVLKEYISHAEKIYNNNYPKYNIAEAKNKINDYKNVIEKMVNRDVSIENLKLELDQLKNEIIAYKKQINNLEVEKQELRKEINNLKNRQKVKDSINIIK